MFEGLDFGSAQEEESFQKFLDGPLKRAVLYARAWHPNQPYDGMPYLEGHLFPVLMSLAVDGYLRDKDMLIASILHDGPEEAPNADAREARLEIIRSEFSARSSTLVRCVTGIGANRTERNADMAIKISNFPESAPLKGHDRLINARTSRRGNLGLHKMYCKEYPAMRALLAPHITSYLLAQLDEAHIPAPAPARA